MWSRPLPSVYKRECQWLTSTCLSGHLCGICVREGNTRVEGLISTNPEGQASSTQLSISSVTL